MGERIQHLFAAFRSLEEFGLERQGDEQKQISEAHEEDTTSQAVEISSLSSPTAGDEKSNRRRYSDAEAVDTNHQGSFYTVFFFVIHVLMYFNRNCLYECCNTATRCTSPWYHEKSAIQVGRKRFWCAT